MIFISDQNVLDSLNWNDTFRSVETAMIKVSKERVVQKPRTFTEVLNTENLLLTMPGYLEDDKFGALACKLVTVWPNNPQLENPLPTINANIALFEQGTGKLKAIIAGTEITKWRTAAASAVATKHVYMNNSKQGNILAILGCGAQGKIHAKAFHKIFNNFTEIRLWNRHVDKSRKLATELNEKFTTNLFKCVENNEQAVRGADVIVTATFATSPIVNFEWVKEGAHINGKLVRGESFLPVNYCGYYINYINQRAVGAGVHHYNELDEKLYRNSDVYIDHWAGAHKELSGLEKLGVRFKGEIGSLITGDLSKSSPNRITIFQSLGMAVEDCALARLVYDLYTKK